MKSISKAFLVLACLAAPPSVFPALAQASKVATQSLNQKDIDAAADFVMTTWAKATIASDADAVVALYTQDALFFGSGTKLRIGSAGVAEYFAGVPKGGVKDVVFSERHAAAVALDTIVVAAFVDFRLNFSGKEELRKWRILLTLVRKPDGQWKIAGHHAAPKEPA